MNKGIVLVMILAISLFLTGCGNTGTTTGKTFIGGTEGLKTSFLSGNPPAVTTDGGTTPFSIGIKMENMGESSIKSSDGYVEIWGADASTYSSKYPDFKKTFSQEATFGEELSGAKMNYGNQLHGGTSTLTFDDLKYVPIITGDNREQLIRANVCYKYSTQATAQICVKNNIEQALSGKEICTVEEEKNPQNSGAPIHITSLKEFYGGNGKIGITLTIAHVGNGDAFFKDDQIKCVDSLSNGDKGKVRIKFKDIQLGGKSIPVVCPGVSEDGYVRLYSEGAGKESTNVQCTIDVSGNKNVVEVPIEAELSYVYLQHIETGLTIRHVVQ